MVMFQSGINRGKISFSALLALSLGIHVALLGGAALMRSSSSSRLPQLQSIIVEINHINRVDQEVNPKVTARSLARQAIVQAKSAVAGSIRPAMPVQPPEGLAPAKKEELPLPVQSQTILAAKPLAAAPPAAAPVQPRVFSQQPAAPAGKTVPVAAQPGSISREYTALIRSMIDKQKEYPLMARKSGAEGTVYIKFVLARDGRLKRAEVSRSSGRNILDRAAMNAVTSVNRFPAVPESMEGAELHFELPLAYKLAAN